MTTTPLHHAGINHGPITAGVIGVKKPHFDMWGNTVNVASRMESTGRAGSIQVVEETANILQHFGFQFDQRGLISVKGKGKLMTYYLTGRQPQRAQASSQQRAISKAAATNGGGGTNGTGPTTIMMPSSASDASAVASSSQGVVAPMVSTSMETNGASSTIRHNMSASSSVNNGLNLSNSRNIIGQQSNCLQESQASLQHVVGSTPPSQSQPPPSSAANDTSNKRMYITPPRQDISTDADVHLV
jgi:hypothetical protein